MACMTERQKEEQVVLFAASKYRDQPIADALLNDLMEDEVQLYLLPPGAKEDFVCCNGGHC